MNKTQSAKIFHTNNQEFWTDERCYISELVNDNACPDVSLALGRVEPGVSTQLHTIGVEEIYTVKRGFGQIEIDGKCLDISPGDSVCIAPDQRQRITNTGKADLIFYLLCRPRFVPETYKNLENSS